MKQDRSSEGMYKRFSHVYTVDEIKDTFDLDKKLLEWLKTSPTNRQRSFFQTKLGLKAPTSQIVQKLRSKKVAEIQEPPQFEDEEIKYTERKKEYVDETKYKEYFINKLGRKGIFYKDRFTGRFTTKPKEIELEENEDEYTDDFDEEYGDDD